MSPRANRWSDADRAWRAWWAQRRSTTTAGDGSNCATRLVVAISRNGTLQPLVGQLNR